MYIIYILLYFPQIEIFSKKKKVNLWFLVYHRPNFSAKHIYVDSCICNFKSRHCFL